MESNRRATELEMSTWWEVHRYEGAGIWVPVADADTEVEAETLLIEYRLMDPDVTLRVRRVRGQA